LFLAIKYIFFAYNINLKILNMEENMNTQPQAAPPAQGVPPIPGAIISLVFGIISLVFCWYFMIPIVGIILCIMCLIFGIIAMNKGKNAINLYNQTPDQYKKGSLGLAKAGKILGLIGLILNAIFIIISIIVTIAVGDRFF